MSPRDDDAGLVSGPPHVPNEGAPTVAAAVDAPADEQADSSCDHDWTVVNRDENRLIQKCTRCGALQRE